MSTISQRRLDQLLCKHPSWRLVFTVTYRLPHHRQKDISSYVCEQCGKIQERVKIIQLRPNEYLRLAKFQGYRLRRHRPGGTDA